MEPDVASQSEDAPGPIIDRDEDEEMLDAEDEEGVEEDVEEEEGVDDGEEGEEIVDEMALEEEELRRDARGVEERDHQMEQD